MKRVIGSIIDKWARVHAWLTVTIERRRNRQMAKEDAAELANFVDAPRVLMAVGRPTANPSSSQTSENSNLLYDTAVQQDEIICTRIVRRLVDASQRGDQSLDLSCARMMCATMCDAVTIYFAIGKKVYQVSLDLGDETFSSGMQSHDIPFGVIDLIQIVRSVSDE